MFIDFISRILGAEKVSVSNRLENDAEPSVIIKKTVAKNNLSLRNTEKTWHYSRASMGMPLKPDSVLILHFKKHYHLCREIVRE